MTDLSALPPGYTSVTLPSRGALYDGKLPDGTVAVRKIKVSEEAAIQGAADGLQLIDAVVGACVKLPPGLAHRDLLTTDRLALLIALRVYTFGPKYEYGFTCAHCGAQNRTAADLGTELAEKKLPEGINEPMELALPDAGVTVGLRFIRGKDEYTISRTTKRTAMQSNDPGDSSHITRIALQIVTVNGEVLDQIAKERFVRDLTMVDSMAMRDLIDTNEPGVDLRLHPSCKACGEETTVTMPFTAEFFRPARRTA